MGGELHKARREKRPGRPHMSAPAAVFSAGDGYDLKVRLQCRHTPLSETELCLNEDLNPTAAG